MIRGLWDRQVDAVIDIKIGDADADTYKYEPMTSLLARWGKIKKDKHGKHCHDQREHFSPFFLSVDGMLGRKALAVIYQLSQLMAQKRGETLFGSMGVGKRMHQKKRWNDKVIFQDMEIFQVMEFFQYMEGLV